MKLKLAGIVVVINLLLFAVAQADDFTVEFNWGDIPLCTTGNPNTVANPRFALSGIPEGTRYLSFTMTDLDVTSYDHGGGGIEYTGQTVIEPGAFRYLSPCPPGGSHRYEWKVTAKNKKGLFAKTLGTAKSVQQYP